MDDLLNDANIGGRIREYVPSDRIRTYIKDAILNAYTKDKKRQILNADSPIDLVREHFHSESTIATDGEEVSLCISTDLSRKFVVCTGTVLKWETALRKALEYIVRTPDLIEFPQIILKLVETKARSTEADQRQIVEVLARINVRVSFRK
ncbi:hypothetical protein SDC9_207159 [bioreactor metagenome]|uniref:Uncharacterized protein n=1 Tax=bioreactor metagenome TaxID=1076179 RepID=A0A645J703_9ZZZZ